MDKISEVINHRRHFAVFPMVCADHGALLMNMTLTEVAEDGERIARALRYCYDLYDYDMVLVFTDPYVEAQALGCPVTLDPYPTLRGPASDHSVDRTEEIIKAAEILKSEIPVPVFVSIKGPFTLAAFLGGVEHYLKATMKNEAEATHILQEALHHQLVYLRKLLSLGVDIMIGDPLASSSVISPRAFCKYALPGLQTLVDMAKAGNVRVGVHICGEVAPILEHLDNLSVDILSIENIDVQTETVRMGGVGTDTILNGDVERIKSEVNTALGNRPIILSTACDVPPQTDPTSIKTMLNTARKIDPDIGVQV
ncbi:MAG: hypothetical protein JSW49_06695 [candidate division WOR-3 bacterium]|nr:MAG: hypothetical protein JSW49_06695 [candidate division WOR-3 bacterium]